MLNSKRASIFEKNQFLTLSKNGIHFWEKSIFDPIFNHSTIHISKWWPKIDFSQQWMSFLNSALKTEPMCMVSSIVEKLNFFNTFCWRKHAYFLKIQNGAKKCFRANVLYTKCLKSIKSAFQPYLTASEYLQQDFSLIYFNYSILFLL